MIRIRADRIEMAQIMLSGVPNGVTRAVVSALNRAASGARTDAVKKTGERYYIKARDVRDTITINKANRDRTRVTIKAKGTRRPLIQFRVRPTEPRPNNPPVVTRVAVVKSGGYKDIARAFLARGTSSGKVHVLQRQSTSRYPIHVKYGPSVPEMIEHNSVRTYVEERAQERLEERLDHEINRLLRGVGR